MTLQEMPGQVDVGLRKQPTTVATFAACPGRGISLLALLWATGLAGCIAVPMRAPTRTIGTLGREGNADLNFLKRGATTRSQVEEKLEWTDTGFKDDQAFFGRWIGSSWTVLWGVGGGYSGDVGSDRQWTLHNVLIEFDEKSVVKNYREFPDEVLVPEISKWAQRRSAPAPSLPVTLKVKHRHGSGAYEDGELVLRDDSVAFHEATAQHDFLIERKKVVRVAAAGKLRKGDADPSFTNQVIYFTEQTTMGNHMTVRMEIPILVVLLEYLQGSLPLGSTNP